MTEICGFIPASSSMGGNLSAHGPEFGAGIIPHMKASGKAIIGRIEKRLKTLGVSENAASVSAGLSRDAIRSIRRNIESGKQRGVSSETLEKLAPALKTSKSWLLSGDGIEVIDQSLSGEGSVNQSPRKGMSAGPLAKNLIGAEPDFELDDLASVPEMDIYGGGGSAGGFNQEENTTDQFGNSVSRDVVRANWGIPAPFLRSELNTSPGRANIIPVRGDSMNDALFAGDRAIINLDDVDVGQDGIFALLDDSASLIIKQVEVVRGSRARRIVCTSRNPAYKPFELELSEPVRIVGRVVGKITRV